MDASIVSQIRKDLKANIDEEYKEGVTRYFKETIRPYGIRTGKVRKISGKYFRKLNKDIRSILILSETLFKSGFSEEGIIAIDFVARIRKKLDLKHFNLFEKWLEKYVLNWGHCDLFSTQVLGHAIEKDSELINKLIKWTKSKNRWKKRAAAVSMIILVRKGENLKESFLIAEKLMHDKDDLVQKGYGWMLKEATRLKSRKVIKFLEEHHKVMPRTAFRYAIEKLPEKERKRLMKL